MEHRPEVALQCADDLRIVIGSFALTTGALAKYFHTLVHSYVTYYGDNVQVMDAKCRRFRRLGVAAAFPSVQVSANPDNVAIVSLGVADYIQSRDPREA